MRVALVIALVLLAGCTTSPDPDGSMQDAATPVTSTASIGQGSFVVTSQGNDVSVVATTYTNNHSAAVLAVHGSVGFRDNNWGELPIEGYCLGCKVADSTHDFFAIDLPGYGDSDDAGEEETIDDWAMVVDQIAIQLRDAGYSSVVGLGHSMGGLIVDMAQGRHDSFDAIVVAGWAHSGFNPEIFTCSTDDTCRSTEDKYYVVDNTDPVVLEYMIDRLGSRPGDVDGNLVYGQRAAPDAGSAQDSHLALIDVPVLVILGDSDHFWNPEEFHREEDYYPEAAGLTLEVVPDAGHFVFHHLNHEIPQSSLLDFLASLG